jgi:serine/threonine protein kinase
MTLDILDGRYQLLHPLGAGGQGRVFRGRDLHTGAVVAVKILDENPSPEAAARFAQEGRLAARIRDPHLIAALHFGVSGKSRYIVYDYLTGVEPVTTLIERAPLDPTVVCDLARQLLGPLEALHQAGVAHLDLSAANCLWRERSTGRLEVFLADLGCAAAAIPVTGGPRRSSEPVGSVHFMAPEMLEGASVDHRADLWSLGSLMYVLLTGNFILDPEDEDETPEIPPPAVIDPNIPAAISDLVMVALARVERRFPSAPGMLAAIDAALADRPPVEGVPLAAKGSHRHAGMPFRAWVGGVVFSAAVATFATMTIMGAPLSSAGERPSEVGLTDVPEPDATSGSVLPPMPANVRPSKVLELTSADLGTTSVAGLPPSPARDTGSTTPHADVGATAVSALPPPTSAVVGVVGVAAPSLTSAKPLTWPMVERAVQGLAGRLRQCSEDDAITLGLQVQRGRVTLTSFDGKPAASLPHHKCARKALASLRLAETRQLSGVVAVVLEP